MTRRAARASMPSLEGVSGDASRPHSAEFLESLTMQKRGEIRWSPLWHNRNYLLFQGGDIISGIGDSVQYLALSLLVLSLTGSPAQAGIVLGLSAIASIVFGLFAGALADRWDRKKIMIWCDIGQMALVGTIPVALWLGKLAMPSRPSPFGSSGQTSRKAPMRRPQVRSASLPRDETERNLPIPDPS
jgi:hypothetical protein